jgi:hypothetical protein
VRAHWIHFALASGDPDSRFASDLSPAGLPLTSTGKQLKSGSALTADNFSGAGSESRLACLADAPAGLLASKAFSARISKLNCFALASNWLMRGEEPIEGVQSGK